MLLVEDIRDSMKLVIKATKMNKKVAFSIKTTTFIFDPESVNKYTISPLGSDSKITHDTLCKYLNYMSEIGKLGIKFSENKIGIAVDPPELYMYFFSDDE
jgi:hypothetical protein